jgi:hypothetical protein
VLSPLSCASMLSFVSDELSGKLCVEESLPDARCDEDAVTYATKLSGCGAVPVLIARAIAALLPPSTLTALTYIDTALQAAAQLVQCAVRALELVSTTEERPARIAAALRPLVESDALRVIEGTHRGTCRLRASHVSCTCLMTYG